MRPEDIRKLLGGYATGTLTAEEQQALFAAALEDQELFDALAREQSLRDLLRDPAARGELLSALDGAGNGQRGFWQWLRRPLVAGLAMAGVTGIAVLAVWQGTRLSAPKQAARVMVAELRPQAPAPSAAVPLESKDQARMADSTVKAVERKRAVSPAPGHVSVGTGMGGGIGATLPAEKKDAAVPAATPPPPPPPASAVMARKAVSDTRSSVEVQAMAAAVESVKVDDARALFYANQPAAGGNAFVAPGASGGLSPAPAIAPRADAGRQGAENLSVARAFGAAALRLGVRVSILRSTGEVDLGAVLDAGEPVRLKLIPNADGFLYVSEGDRMVASGTAQRLTPFETPELRFAGSGPKQLYVMLSRRAQNVATLSPGSLARDGLVESSAKQESATYVVSGLRDAGAQQVVVPVTLTFK